MPPRCFLLVTAIGKSRNIGMLMRSAVAFNAEIVLCGSNFKNYGSQGTHRFAVVHGFPTAAEGVTFLRTQGARILGIEITPGAEKVDAHPFSGPTAFLPGNEGTGLAETQKALCDGFIYVPQFGNGTGSLNVGVATGIVLHHFGSWAGYGEVARDPSGDKFEVDAAAVAWRGEYSAAQAAVRDARARARQPKE